MKGYTGQKYITTFLFLLIPLVLLTLFTIIPAINMFVFSFQSRDPFGLHVEWIGMGNYVTLLCSKIRLAGVFKGIIFFPYLMNGVAVALIFLRFFQGDNNGTLNAILGVFGVDPVRWLSNKDLNNWCLVFASVWRYIGFDILMFISAIQSISPDIYEACDLDGANAWQRFWYIVFPRNRPIIVLQLILAIKGAISVFEIPYIITGGRFDTSTFVISTLDVAFGRDMVGLGSAMAVVLLILIIIVTAIQKLCFKEEK